MPHSTGPLTGKLMIRSTSTILLSCLLAACGGGGGGGGANSGAGGGSPVVAVDKTSPSVGDFYTYKLGGYTITNVTSQYPYDPVHETELITAVSGAGATVKTLYGDQYTGWFDGSATLKGSYQAGRFVFCKTTYTAGTYGPPAQLALNATWDNSTSLTRDCGSGSGISTSKLTSKGVVVAIESITVAAGTFNAYKLVATVVDETTSPDPFGNPSVREKLTTKVTSWLDQETGVELKRIAEELADPATGTRYDRDVVTRELIGLSHARSGRQVLVTERFAGQGWKGSYSGKLNGTCFANILNGGVIDARCAEGTSTVNTFFPEGTINNSGQVNFALPSGGTSGPKFAGQAESLTKISGTWSDGAGATGTWVFTRDN